MILYGIVVIKYTYLSIVRIVLVQCSSFISWMPTFIRWIPSFSVIIHIPNRVTREWNINGNYIVSWLINGIHQRKLPYSIYLNILHFQYYSFRIWMHNSIPFISCITNRRRPAIITTAVIVMNIYIYIYLGKRDTCVDEMKNHSSNDISSGAVTCISMNSKYKI